MERDDCYAVDASWSLTEYHIHYVPPIMKTTRARVNYTALAYCLPSCCFSRQRFFWKTLEHTRVSPQVMHPEMGKWMFNADE